MDTFALIADYLSDQRGRHEEPHRCFPQIVEALQQAGAIPYERTDSRKAHRNGYKDRSLKTRYGKVNYPAPVGQGFPAILLLPHRERVPRLDGAFHT